MSRLEDIGAADGWRCWLCDQAVDPQMAVNDARGPSIDAVVTKAKAKTGPSVFGLERLAHRGCNTKKGARAPVVPWSDDLFVVDPAPIVASIERLARKGGRVLMARCPTAADARQSAVWLTDRISRLCPGLELDAAVEPGGGQFLVALSVS